MKYKYNDSWDPNTDVNVRKAAEQYFADKGIEFPANAKFTSMIDGAILRDNGKSILIVCLRPESNYKILDDPKYLF